MIRARILKLADRCRLASGVLLILVLPLAGNQVPSAPGQTVDYGPLYLPLAMAGGGIPTGPDPVPTSHVPSPTATLEPVPATPTATAEPPVADVVFQLATWGGLTEDLQLGWIPHQTPTFTLFEDGTYVRRHRAIEWDHVEVAWLTGHLDRASVDALLGQLVGDARFFDIPATPPPMSCATDGPDDYLYLSTGDQTHRVTVYGLSWYEPELTCGWPVAGNLEVLAGIVRTFESPLAAGETVLEFNLGTIAAAPGETDTAPAWPVPTIRLSELPDSGWYRSAPVEGDEVSQVSAAIEPHGWDGTSAWFEEEGIDWLVGLRVEFPGWQTYR